MNPLFEASIQTAGYLTRKGIPVESTTIYLQSVLKMLSSNKLTPDEMLHIILKGGIGLGVGFMGGLVNTLNNEHRSVSRALLFLCSIEGGLIGLASGYLDTSGK